MDIGHEVRGGCEGGLGQAVAAGVDECEQSVCCLQCVTPCMAFIVWVMHACCFDSLRRVGCADVPTEPYRADPCCDMLCCLQELSRRMTAAMKEAHGKSVAGGSHSVGGGTWFWSKWHSVPCLYPYLCSFSTKA
jgi:hypothetical protein